MDELVHNAVVLEIHRVEPAIREAQLIKDRDRLLSLQLENFEGKVWRETELDLIGYARRVLPAKIYTGEIFSIMRKVGIPPATDLYLPSPPPTFEERRDLAEETIARSLPHFKNLLVRGIWDPQREHVASMRTFFIGNCALKFSSPWRLWYRSRSHEPEVVYLDPTDLLEVPDERGRIDQSAVDRVTILNLLQMIPDPLTQKVLVLDAFDFSNKKIASHLDVSEKVVEYRLRKAKELFPKLRAIHDRTA